MAPHLPLSESREQGAPQLAFWLVLFGVPTLLLNRAIIPALPGSTSDIEQLLDRALAIGSISSQLLALVITLLLIRLIVSSIGAAAIGAVERLFVLPVGSAVGFLVVAASAGTLDPELHLLLAGITTVGLIICARPALRHPSTRAGGLLLVLIILASLCFTAARLMALRASIEALPRQYAVARGLATAGQVFDGLSLTWVMIWAVITSSSRGVSRIVMAVVTMVAIAILGRYGQRSDPSFLPLITARVFGVLGREPGAYGPGIIGPASDLLAMLLSLALLTLRNPENVVARRAMALLLLGRCSLDVPVLAGMATAGGLLLAWFTPHNVPSNPHQAVEDPCVEHPGDPKGSGTVQVAANTSAP